MKTKKKALVRKPLIPWFAELTLLPAPKRLTSIRFANIVGPELMSECDFLAIGRKSILLSASSVKVVRRIHEALEAEWLVSYVKIFPPAQKGGGR